MLTFWCRENLRHFADDIFKCIFLNENSWISIRISLKFVSMDEINNIPALLQIMAWRRLGDKPLSESMRVSLLTHICVTRTISVNTASPPPPQKKKKKNHIGVIITSQKTPHCSLFWLMAVTVAIYVVSYHIGQRYNGTRLYIFDTHTICQDSYL